MNRWDEMRVCVTDAERTMNAADSVAAQMARVLRGRLRHASSDTLRALKKELQGFNAKTGEWS